MKNVESLGLTAIATIIAVGLAACDKQPGPAETAGKKVDRAIDDAGKKIGEAADKVKENVGEQSAKASVVMDDAEITAKVKAAIFSEPGLKTLAISVDTVNGVVTLSGSVDSPSNSDRAAALAGAVAGVKQVENRLVAMNK